MFLLLGRAANFTLAYLRDSLDWGTRQTPCLSPSSVELLASSIHTKVGEALSYLWRAGHEVGTRARLLILLLIVILASVNGEDRISNPWVILTSSFFRFGADFLLAALAFAAFFLAALAFLAGLALLAASSL